MTNPRVDAPKPGDDIHNTSKNTSQAKLIRMGYTPNTGAGGKKRPVG